MYSREQVFSGVDALTGGYLRPAFAATHYAPPRVWRDHVLGFDPCRLDEAGWAVVFAPQVPPAVREALRPLLELRRQQAGALYRVIDWQPRERRARAFLNRHAAPYGAPEPQHLPYYLLLVGSPAEIPFPFQYGLDADYAVGRLHFGAVAEYAAYAQTVVAAETGRTDSQPARLAVFAPTHAHDHATQLCVRGLAAPLVEKLRAALGVWTVEAHLSAAATRACLARLFGLEATPPRLLFTAGHGLHFSDADRQAREEGALVCAEWPGGRPEERRAVRAEEYFSAEHLGEARMQGGIVFNLACHSAGTQRFDYVAYLCRSQRVRRVRHTLLAPLARRLLGREAGALAVVGHVDTALLDPMLWSNRQVNVGDFEVVLKGLARGWPVGAAMERFGRRHAALAREIAEGEEPQIASGVRPLRTFLPLRLACNDARGYIVAGDPAVRLRVSAALATASPVR